VSREAIYEAFPDDYRGSAAAREKKFTRDKEALLSLGIALRFVEEEGEQGAYVLDLTSSFLPALSFSPEEAAVVWAAGQAAVPMMSFARSYFSTGMMIRSNAHDKP